MKTYLKRPILMMSANGEYNVVRRNVQVKNDEASILYKGNRVRVYLHSGNALGDSPWVTSDCFPAECLIRLFRTISLHIRFR